MHLRRDTLCKGMEGAADIRKVFEIIQMVAFHIQNHTDEGLELQKAVEIFACLGNEIRRVTDFRLLLMVGRMPPTVMVGSVPAASRISETMDVVVVLPCVPATAMESSYSAMISPSSLALSIRGICFACAA